MKHIYILGKTKRVKLLQYADTLDKKAAVDNLQKLGYEAKIVNGVITVDVPEDADINKEFEKYKKTLRDMNYRIGAYAMRKKKGAEANDDTSGISSTGKM